MAPDTVPDQDWNNLLAEYRRLVIAREELYYLRRFLALMLMVWVPTLVVGTLFPAGVEGIWKTYILVPAALAGLWYARRELKKVRQEGAAVEARLERTHCAKSECSYRDQNPSQLPPDNLA